jgi:hypothetical protein
MSYEQQIKLKHAIEDSFGELLSCTSALTDRELEIAMARTADSIANNTDVNAIENLKIVGEVLQKVLRFREVGQMRQNKPKRVWYSMRKSTLRRQIVEPLMDEYTERHENQCMEIEKRNRERVRAHEQAVASIKKERESMSFFKQLFAGPRLPPGPSLEIKPSMPSLVKIEAWTVGDLDTDELLIRRIVAHRFPHTNLAKDFATEDNLKTIETRLLSQS